jgi:hypothetical protein
VAVSLAFRDQESSTVVDASGNWCVHLPTGTAGPRSQARSGRNRDDRASVAHALMHLTANKIADDDYPGHGGWYCGNKAQFVKRHKKAVALMQALLTQNATAEARCKASPPAGCSAGGQHGSD